MGPGKRSSRSLSPHPAQPLSGSWPRGQDSRACFLCCGSIKSPPYRTWGQGLPTTEVERLGGHCLGSGALPSVLTASVPPTPRQPLIPSYGRRCQPHTAQTSDPLWSPQKCSGCVGVATQAGTSSLHSAASAASIWGLAEPEPAGWADWELRPVLEWAPRSAQGCQAQFKVSGPCHPQPCTRGGPCPPPSPGRQPCRNLRGRPPPHHSLLLLRGSAQLCRLEKPTPAHRTLSPGQGPAPSALKLFLGLRSFPCCSLGLGRPVRASSPDPQARGDPALPPAPSPGRHTGCGLPVAGPGQPAAGPAAPARRRPAEPRAWRPEREVADTQNKTCRIPLTSAPALWQCPLMGALLPGPRPLSGQPPSSAGRAGSLQGQGVPPCG